MNLIKLLLRASWPVVLIATIAGIASGAASAGLIAIINRKLGGGPGSGLARDFIALCALALVSKIISQTLLARLAQDSIFALRAKLSRRILAAPLRQLEELGAHRLLVTLTDDTLVITNALTTLPLICVNGAIIVCCLIYLGTLSPRVLGAAVLFMAIGIVSFRLPAARAIGGLRRAREAQDLLFKHLRALIEGIKELKLNSARQQAFLAEDLERVGHEMRRHNVAGLTAYIAAANWGQLLFFIAIGVLLFLPPAGASSAIVTGYTLTILYMTTPLEVIMGTFPLFGRAAVAFNKVDALGLALTSEPRADSVPPGPSWRQLTLTGIKHSYYREREESSFTLGPIDLSLRPAEVVFLVGGNGSGKTTLAKLITGLYTPEAGQIRLDQITISDENRQHYRERFSAIFADYYLFERLPARADARLDAQAQAYLKRLELDHKVAVKDGLLSTSALSQGQRKRLALLAAYLEDRAIYLFDEWAADQDPSFKALFYTVLVPELKARGKAVVVITHDDKYFHLADRLIKIDYGQIVEASWRDVPARLG